MESVSCAVVTRDRPDDLKRLIESLSDQTADILKVCVVDSGTPAEWIKETDDRVEHIYSFANLGGAGGYALAVLHAIASGADWVWLMDDDACPIGADCLEKLLTYAQQNELDAVSPLVVSPQDHERLAFPFKAKGKLTTNREDVNDREFIPNDAHFFNGLLIRTRVLYEVGLPDFRLFIRGDDVDFVLRLKQAKMKFGTYTQVAISHPPGWNEQLEGFGNNLVLMPEGAFKRYYFFRNRGYIARRYKSFKRFRRDVGFYTYYFLFKRKFDLPGLRSWWSAYSDGLMNRLGKTIE